MELRGNQIIKNNRGNYGYTVEFNGKVSLLIYQGYYTKPNQLDQNLAIFRKGDNDPYSISEVYENNSLINEKDLFSKEFKPEKYNLKLLWKR